MMTRESLDLKNSRANYVRTLRKYEEKHGVVTRSLRIRRQTIVDESSNEPFRTIIAGIGESFVSESVFFSEQIEKIDEGVLKGGTPIILDEYDE